MRNFPFPGHPFTQNPKTFCKNRIRPRKCNNLSIALIQKSRRVILMRATKWALVISLAFVGISCNAGQAKSDVLIKNDGGGNIPQYIAKYLYLQLRGERVVIDGDCLSACTLALGLLAKEQRCFTNEARLGFHDAWIGFGTRRIWDPLGTAVFWLVYPAEIRRWISRHGGLTSKVIYLEGKELAAMYPPCRRFKRA